MNRMPDSAANSETPWPLIGESDPPPIEIVNPAGAARVILACDHASRAIPSGLDSLGLGDTALRRHIAWDIGAAEVTRQLAMMLDARAVLAGYSRLLIDCNRDLDDPTLIPVISEDVVVPGNRDLDPTATADRVASFYQPYHDRLEHMISALCDGETVPAVLFVHSFTPIYRRIERPWHIGILWDRDPRLPMPLIDALRDIPDICVGDNQPYSAQNGHDFTNERHAGRTGLAHALIEIRQDLIDTHHGALKWARLLYDMLRPILADDGLYRARRA